MITDLGIGGEDVLIIPSTAYGVTATVTQDYVANSLTTNNNTNLDRIVLNADDGIDINMAAASKKNFASLMVAMQPRFTGQ